MDVHSLLSPVESGTRGSLLRKDDPLATVSWRTAGAGERQGAAQDAAPEEKEDGGPPPTRDVGLQTDALFCAVCHTPVSASSASFVSTDARSTASASVPASSADTSTASALHHDHNHNHNHNHNRNHYDFRHNQGLLRTQHQPQQSDVVLPPMSFGNDSSSAYPLHSNDDNNNNNNNNNHSATNNNYDHLANAGMSLSKQQSRPSSQMDRPLVHFRQPQQPTIANPSTTPFHFQQPAANLVQSSYSGAKLAMSPDHFQQPPPMMNSIQIPVQPPPSPVHGQPPAMNTLQTLEASSGLMLDRPATTPASFKMVSLKGRMLQEKAMSEPNSVATSRQSSPEKKQRQSQEEVRKTRENLPKDATRVLREWLLTHASDPYPSEDQKIALATQLDLTPNQVNNWFINARRRILLPMLQEKKKFGIHVFDEMQDASVQLRTKSYAKRFKKLSHVERTASTTSVTPASRSPVSFLYNDGQPSTSSSLIDHVSRALVTPFPTSHHNQHVLSAPTTISTTPDLQGPTTNDTTVYRSNDRDDTD